MIEDNWPNRAKDNLDLLVKEFDLFPCRGEHADGSLEGVIHKTPEPADWSNYLQQHPNDDIGSKYRAMALWLASDRAHVESLGESYIRLAGTVIGCAFNQQELLEIASTQGVGVDRQ